MPKRNLDKRKVYNILLLGETGVGKSTWINGFVNYLTYKTMKDAKHNQVVYLVPMSFHLTDSNYQPIKVTVGADKNEQHCEVGQSVTQSPQSYLIPYGDFSIRLIDNPGICDTRGIKQDNFQLILNNLAQYEDVHCICILVKPNCARFTASFSYCIKELLIHLHKEACKNIIFCFTHCRGARMDREIL